RVEISLSASAVRDEVGKICASRMAWRDVSERKKAERRRRARAAVTTALAESKTLSEGSSKVLQSIGEELDWDVGEFWLVDRQDNSLKCYDTWSQITLPQSFFQVAHRTVFRLGVGLPGYVWKSAEPLYMADVLHQNRFPVPPSAAHAQLRGAFAFPI